MGIKSTIHALFIGVLCIKYHLQLSVTGIDISFKDKFLEEGVESIIGHLCNLDALGCINAEQMLKCIHQYSSRRERA